MDPTPAFTPKPRMRQEEVDSIVEFNRAATPQSVQDQRAVRRYSIAELNAANMDDLRRDLAKGRLDDRPPFVKVLDLIDLPRNTLFQLARPTVQRKRGELEYGAFGLPVVRTSDILKDMGVESGVVRGIVGFAGDTLFDPLILLGPAKGLSVAGTTARGVSVGARVTGAGRKALQQGVRAATRDGLQAVRSDRVRSLLSASLGRGSEDLAAQRLARFRSRVGRTNPATGKAFTENDVIARLRGRLSSREKNGRIVQGRSNIMARAFDPDAPDLIDDAVRSTDEIARAEMGRASRAFLDHYGKRGPGVAHIPFTTKELRLPAITAAQRQQRDLFDALGQVARGGDESLVAAEAIAKAKSEAAQTLARVADDFDALRREEDKVRAAGAVDGDDVIADIRARRAGLDEAYREAVRVSDETVAQAESVARNFPRDLGTTKNLNEILMQQQRLAGLESQARMFRQRAATNGRRAGLHEEIRKYREEGLAILRSGRDDFDPALDTGTLADLAETRYFSNAGKFHEWMNGFDGAMANRVLDMTEAEVDAAIASAKAQDDAFVESLRAGQGLYGNLLAATTAEDRLAANLVRKSLGLASDEMGATLMAPMGRAMAIQDESAKRRQLGNAVLRIDDGYTRVFGPQRGSLMRRLMRNYTVRVKDVAGLEARRQTAAMMTDVMKALEATGLDPKNPENLDRADQFLTALFYQRFGAIDPITGVRGRFEFGIDDLAMARMAPGEDGVWRAIPGSGRIEELVRSGVAGVGAESDLYPGLRQRLEEIVDKHGEFLYDMGQQEVAADVLGKLNVSSQYLPMTPTDAGRQSISIKKQFPGFSADQSRDFGAVAAQEGFEKAKTTRRFRAYLRTPEDFVRPAGFAGAMADLPPKLRVYEDEAGRLYQRFHGYDMASDSPEMKALVEKFGAQPQIDRKAYDISVYEWNRMAADGDMQALVSGDFADRKFVEDSLTRIFAARRAQHERFMATRQFIDTMMKYGVAVDSQRDLIPVLGKPRTYLNDAGQEMVEEVINGRPHFRIGNELFRRLSVPEGSLLRGALGDDSRRLIYHADTAKAIEEAARILTPENLPSVVSVLDTATKWWKAITLAHPSWMIVDAVGHTVNGLAGGVRPQDLVRDIPNAMRAVTLAYRNPDKLAEITFDLGEAGVVRGDELLETLTQAGVLNQSLVAREVLAAFNTSTLRNQVFLERASLPAGVRSKEELSRIAESPFNRFGSSSRFKNFMAPWFRANAGLADSYKVAFYLSFRRQGMDAAEAVAQTNRVGFDMGDLTKVESSFGRRVLPFYSWMRNNAAYQFQLLKDRPIVFNMPQHLQEALEEAINGEQQVPMHERPNWMRSQLAIQLGRDTAIQTLSALPQQDFFTWAQAAMGREGLQEFLKFFVTSANPSVLAPVQAGAGVEFFTGRSIAATREQGDQSMGEFFAGQIRPFREIYNPVGGSPGAITKAVQQGSPGLGVSRALLGGRVQDFSEDRRERLQLREFQDRETNLRRAISRAEREGRNSDSLAARTRLMLLYRKMMEAGLESEVPVWARNQLAEISGARGVP